MSADHGVYCERCGTHIELLDGPPVHLCSSCRVVSCQGCWDPAHGICAACTVTRTANGSIPERLRGLGAARWNLRQLAALRADVANLMTAPADGDLEPGRDVDLELLLLGARLRTLRDDAELEVVAASLQTATKMTDLVRRRKEEGDAIEQILAEVWTRRVQRRLASDAPRRPPLGEWLTPHRDRLIHIGAGVAAVAILAVVAPLIPVLADRLVPAAPGETPRPERAAVLGGTAERETPAKSDSALEPASTIDTFDDWRMTGPLASEWGVERGSSEQVAVAAFPSAVDRSLELIASSRGNRVTACRGLPEGLRGIVVDILIETPDAELHIAMPAADRSASEPAWLITTDASAGASDATVPIVADDWYRFEVVVDRAAAVLSWEVLHPGRDADNARSFASGEVALIGDLDEICLSVPPAVADGRVLIDNLTITHDR